MSAETSHVTDISGGATTGTAATPKKPQQAKRVDGSPTGANASASSAKSQSMPASIWPTVDVTKYFEEARGRLQEAFEQANGRFDNIRSAARDTGDVCQECQLAAVSGLKDMNERVFELIQGEMDRGYDFLRSATEVKGVSDLMQLQADYIRETMETQLDHGKSMAELTTNLFKATFAPLQSGMFNVFDTARKRS